MRARRDSSLSALALTVAAIALGQALQYANGAYTPDALQFVTLAIGLVVLVVASPQPNEWVDRGILGLVLVAAAAGLSRELYVHLVTTPGIYLRGTNETMLEHHRLIACVGVLTGVLIALGRGPVRAIAVVVYAGLFFALGAWMLKASPAPIIDVFTWHNVSFAAFAKGTNPYAIYMPNIYGHTMWYAAGLVDPVQVKVGYPYPPLTFLLSGLAHALTGDYRYVHVASLAVTGVLLSFARPDSRLGPIAMAILFLSPRSLFVIEQGWTESLSIVHFAVVVFCACRFPKALPYVLGLLFAVKQYFVLLAPLTFLILPGPFSWRAWGQVLLRAGVVAAVVTAPFFLWDPGAFWRSVVEFQGKQPFRVEALSFVAATAVNGVPTWPLWLSFPAIIPGTLLALVRSPKTPTAFAAGSALVFMLFFAFAKQAFCNYYFLIIGMLCCALAATAEFDASTEDAALPS